MKTITELGFYESFLESTGHKIQRPICQSEIENIINNDSCLLLEGVSVYLKMTGPEEMSKKYQDCPKSFVNVVYKSGSGKNNPTHYITTDLLTLYWCGWMEDLKYLSELDPHHHELRIKIQNPEKIPEEASKLKFPEDTYVAFFSDWVENGVIDKL